MLKIFTKDCQTYQTFFFTLLSQRMLTTLKRKWVKGPGGSRYNEDAGVFAFDNPEDAINWASKMRFDHKQTPISIVRLTIDPDNPIWDEDPAQDPIMRATLKGRALKSSQNINAERIVDAVDFTDLGTPGSHDMDRDEWIEKVAIPALNAR
jgi:hypothetical protein